MIVIHLSLPAFNFYKLILQPDPVLSVIAEKYPAGKIP